MTRLKDDGPSLGAWCSLSSALSIEGVSRAGFDWVCIDMQHGAADFEHACDMIRAADLARVFPVVRVPWNDPGIIGRVLDAGALGVIVPMIQTVEEAKRVAEACLYPPDGRRSFGPLRVSLRDGMSYFGTANARIAVLPMIETREALASVKDILAVPGVSGAFVGPMDLSVALGLPPADNDGTAIFDDAIRQVVAACRDAGKKAAVYSNAKVAALRVRQGFNMISITNDFGALMGALRSDLAAVKTAIQESA